MDRFKNDELVEPVKVTNSTDNKDQKSDSEIINSFPDWDLLPPYQTVRRINRK